MRSAQVVAASLALAMLLGCVPAAPQAILDRTHRYDEVRTLPTPRTSGTVSIEQALSERRSEREYTRVELSATELGQLFWAAQGITDSAGRRTAPSAGARYPLEIYAMTSNEFMHYLPDGHRVEVGSTGDRRKSFGPVAFGQEWIDTAPAVFVITGVVSRTEREYAGAARRLVDREAGHAAQNVLLEATALGLASVPVGGFDPAAIRRLLLLSPREEVLYLIPIGHVAASSNGE